MDNTTLLGSAKINLLSAKTIRGIVMDDAMINIVAYHLQQAVELSLKYALENIGIKYPYTHDIDVLVKLVMFNSKLDLEYVEDEAAHFTLWEAKTRYVKGSLASAKKVDKLTLVVDQLLKQIENAYPI